MLELKKIEKSYSNGIVTCDVLHDVNLKFENGEIVSITGASGAGKSTLLHILALLDTPTAGSVYLDGKDVSNLSIGERADIRLKNFGFVFQDYQLVSTLNAHENIIFPSLYKNKKIDQSLYDKIIRDCGLNQLLAHFPHELSGGEQQRVAVCRALLSKPNIIFADEPTGNLDSKNAETIFSLLLQYARENHCTLIYVTHEKRFAALADYSIVVCDGVCSKQNARSIINE